MTKTSEIKLTEEQQKTIDDLSAVKSAKILETRKAGTEFKSGKDYHEITYKIYDRLYRATLWSNGTVSHWM